MRYPSQECASNIVPISIQACLCAPYRRVQHERLPMSVPAGQAWSFTKHRSFVGRIARTGMVPATLTTFMRKAPQSRQRDVQHGTRFRKTPGPPLTARDSLALRRRAVKPFFGARPLSAGGRDQAMDVKSLRFQSSLTAGREAGRFAVRQGGILPFRVVGSLAWTKRLTMFLCCVPFRFPFCRCVYEHRIVNLLCNGWP